MEVKLEDLRRMSRKDRNRTIAELARAATSHRDTSSVFTNLVHAIRNFLAPGRVSR